MRSDRISNSGRQGGATLSAGLRVLARAEKSRLTLLALLGSMVVLAACGSPATDGPEGSAVTAAPATEATPVVTVPEDILATAAGGDSATPWAPAVILVLLAAVLFAVLRNIETSGRG